MCRKPKTVKIEQCLAILHEEFDGINDPRSGISEIPLRDFLLSSYAIFSLKYPSLLGKFETKKRLWVEMVSIFKLVYFENWDHFFQCLLGEGTLNVEFIPGTG